MKDFFWVLDEQFKQFSRDNFNKTESIYTFNNGSEVGFVGLDEEAKFRGRKQDYGYMNEANECEYETYKQLALRTTKQLILDYNPSSESSWIYDRVIPRDDTAFIKSTYKKNKFLEQAIIDEIESMEPTEKNIAQGTADPTNWKIFGLGERASHKGLIFSDWVIVPDLPHPDKWDRWWYGQDFGFTNDATAMIMTVLCEGVLYHKQMIYKRGLTNIINLKNTDQDSIEAWYQRLFISKKKTIWCDPAEPKSIQDLRNCGYECRPADKGPDSILAGIDTLKRFKNCITEDSMDLIKETKNYKWKEDKQGNAMNEPIDKWNHCIDALRYSCYMELRRTDVLHKVYNPNEKEKLGFRRTKKQNKNESYYS